MKEKMLKIFAALLALCLIAAAVTACKGQTDKETTKAPEQTAEDTTAPEDDTTGAEDDTTEAPVDGTTSPEEQSTVPEYDDETTEEETADVDPDGTPDEPKFVTDHAGNEVHIPERIDRIVVCDIYPLPSILTVFFDSADKLVGIAPASMSAAKSSLLGELYPDILKASTGFAQNNVVNVEEVAKLKPDIVFYNAGNKDLGANLRAVGLNAFAMSAGKWGYDALETLNQWIKTFDQIFPGNDKYATVKEYGEKALADVQARVGKIEDKKKALFLFQYTDKQVQVNGKPSFGAWWSEAIGVENTVTEKTEANSLAVSMEEIYAMDPDILFVTNFTTASADDIYENKIGTYDWSPVKAVQDKRVYKMPLGMYRSYTSGVDSPVALYWLAKAAYPEAFEDIDITEYTKGYYKDVFGITLTDEQANKIFDPDAAAGKMN